MAVSVAVPAEAMRGRYSFGDDHLDADREAPERGPAQNQIADMAVLLGNTRGSVILGGSVLSALTIGIALEAAFSPSVLRPGLAGVVAASLLGCVIVCWLRAAGLLLLASRPVLDQLNDHRWRTGAPLDPRVRWLSTPPTGDSEAAWSWAQVNMYDLKGTFVGQAAAMSIVNFTLVVVIVLVFLRLNRWNRQEAA